jgi:hypothetical protein
MAITGHCSGQVGVGDDGPPQLGGEGWTGLEPLCPLPLLGLLPLPLLGLLPLPLLGLLPLPLLGLLPLPLLGLLPLPLLGLLPLLVTLPWPWDEFGRPLPGFPRASVAAPRPG